MNNYNDELKLINLLNKSNELNYLKKPICTPFDDITFIDDMNTDDIEIKSEYMSEYMGWYRGKLTEVCNDKCEYYLEIALNNNFDMDEQLQIIFRISCIDIQCYKDKNSRIYSNIHSDIICDLLNGIINEKKNIY